MGGDVRIDSVECHTGALPPAAFASRTRPVRLLASTVDYILTDDAVQGAVGEAAVTLGVATMLDLFVVWFFKRPTIFLIAKSERLVNLRGFGLRSGVAADAAGEGATA